MILHTPRQQTIWQHIIDSCISNNITYTCIQHTCSNYAWLACYPSQPQSSKFKPFCLPGQISSTSGTLPLRIFPTTPVTSVRKKMSHQILPWWQKDTLSAFRRTSKCSFYHPTTFQGAAGAYTLRALICGSMLWSAISTAWHLLTADGKTAVVFTLSSSVTHQTCFCLSDAHCVFQSPCL